MSIGLDVATLEAVIQDLTNKGFVDEDGRFCVPQKK